MTATRNPFAPASPPPRQLVMSRYRHHLAAAKLAHVESTAKRIALKRTCVDARVGSERETLDAVVSLVVEVLTEMER